MRRNLALAAVLTCAALASGCELITPPSNAPAPQAAAAPSAGAAPAAAPPQKVVRIIVPRPVKCVPDDVGAPPAYPDTDTALREAGGAADRYQLLAAGRILREQRLQRLEEVVRRCRNVGR